MLSISARPTYLYRVCTSINYHSWQSVHIRNEYIGLSLIPEHLKSDWIEAEYRNKIFTDIRYPTSKSSKKCLVLEIFRSICQVYEWPCSWLCPCPCPSVCVLDPVHVHIHFHVNFDVRVCAYPCPCLMSMDMSIQHELNVDNGQGRGQGQGYVHGNEREHVHGHRNGWIFVDIGHRIAPVLGHSDSGINKWRYRVLSDIELIALHSDINFSNIGLKTSKSHVGSRRHNFWCRCTPMLITVLNMVPPASYLINITFILLVFIFTVFFAYY